MKGFKSIIVYGLFFCLFVGCTATPPKTMSTPSQLEQFFGVVVAADWEKSYESYCQGGSEYYVLETETQQITLNSVRDTIHTEDDYAAFEAMQGELQAQLGKTVIVKGKLITHTFSEDEHCPDPLMQCITGPITCTWLRVVTIE